MIRRFSVSIENDILQLLDKQVRQGYFPNRSDALRAMIRTQAVQKQLESQGEVIAVASIVYDHHKRNLVNKILHVQHDISAHIMGAQHFHLDHHHCIETILARGLVRDLEKFEKALKSLRGIKYASLSIIAPSKNLK